MIDKEELYKKALEATKHAYAPYSGFQVGAALLTHTGEVFTGVNVENSSFGGTICAERAVVVKAVSEGHRRFCALAVATPRGKASPCGICRQFIYEFGDDILIISGEDVKHLQACTIKELLPDGFRLPQSDKQQEKEHK